MAIKKQRTREFEFPVSGKKAHFPIVSMAAQALKAQRKYPAPDPPSQIVDYGGGKTKKEYNYAHPDYEKAMTAWTAFVEAKSGEWAISRATKIKLNAEQQKEVDEWKKENDDLWDEYDTDASIWLEEIGIEEEADFEAMLEFIVNAGEPTKEVVESNQDGFQS